ncbi:hypothetical protein D0864_04977 [Hortaea werneckii]|uniref:Protein kinase domain-containing protein n=1 Tax=Hortaea werneckii TaxID=91943 RepID=A0A3M7G748_HORWE|nr:hypothetical protein D0864_04977 [Hortaea werneckii]
MDCILLVDGHRVDVADLIGNGTDGFIIRKGDHVLKIPQLFGRLRPDGTIEADTDNDLHYGHLENEKQVYERLRGVPGIAECVECTNNGILLKYYPNGALSEYIASHSPPPMAWRWKWALQATDIIAHCHEKSILVYDIALRNFLLADDFSLRLIDFSNSSLLPTTMDISLAEADGSTAKLDFLHLSNVIYSILTWQKFTIECAMESEWPDINQFPDLKGAKFGSVLQRCWERHYTTIEELVRDIRLCAEASSFSGPL